MNIAQVIKKKTGLSYGLIMHEICQSYQTLNEFPLCWDALSDKLKEIEIEERIKLLERKGKSVTYELLTSMN